MDHGAILSASLTYVRETCRPERWFYLFLYLLINVVTCAIVPLYAGYLYRVMESKPGIPEVSNIRELFVNGWKMNIAGIIYAIPILLLSLVFLFLSWGTVSGIFSGAVLTPEAAVGFLLNFLVFILVLIVVSFGIGLFSTLGVVRMARSGTIREAFNFTEILAAIRRIGWMDYIAAILILIVCSFIFSIVLEFLGFAFSFLVGVIGSMMMMFLFIWMLVYILLAAAFAVFIARYTSKVYDEGNP